MSRRPITILVTGDPVPAAEAARGNYVTMVRRAAGDAWGGPWADVDLRGDQPLPSPAAVAGIVITGSASSVTERAEWMLRAEAYLRDLVAAKAPVLGICFGHQLLAQALGGVVTKNPKGREIGTVDFRVCREDPLFSHAGSAGSANQTHVDSVTKVPPGAIRLATTALDENAALRFSETAWGVQFHPEMDAQVIRYYIEARRDLLVAEGLFPDRLVANADDAVHGRDVLRHFLSRVATRKDSGGVD